MATSYTGLAKACSLIVGPILLGAGVFLAIAPSQEPGVYAEVGSAVYRLAPCDTGEAKTLSTDSPSHSRVVQAFFVVRPAMAQEQLPATWAQLFLTVVNHAEPESGFGRLAIDTEIRRMGSGIYRIVSSQSLMWKFGGIFESVYRQTLAQYPGSRATTELLVELEVPHPSGQGTCRYGVILGPPSDQPDSSLGWFVAPPGELR